MKLNEQSYRWAIKHLFKESDTDLFPRPIELAIIHEMSDELLGELVNIDLGNYQWNSSRRFIVPKDDVAHRVATQLDLIDSIVLGAIIFEFGSKIEQRRLNANKVFSYRFLPTPDGTIYSNRFAWTKFWKACLEEVERVDWQYIVACDISDFYNQIYLHTIENQLIECGFPNQVKESIKNLMISITQRNSRGIPIGPHCSHLIAEMCLIPIDENLSIKDIPFKRYVDDFVIFCESEKEARVRINQMAEILDKDQRLVLQRQKTKIYYRDDFVSLCKRYLLQETENETENELIDIINEYAGGDAYVKIQLDDIKDEHLAKLSEDNIIDLLDSYLKISSPNYEKIRWIYRRLSQIGIPHAIDYSIEHFDELVPALNDVCLYINSCAENYDSDWKVIAEEILDLIDDEIIESNEFFKISLLNLFVYNTKLNHFSALIKLFNSSSENVKRKILLSSSNHNAASWVRELKEQYGSFNSWTKRAFLIAAKNLPIEERNFFYKGIKATLGPNNILERIIIKWATK